LSKEDNYTQLKSFKEHTSPIISLNSIFNDMGKFVLSGDKIGQVIIWNLEKNLEVY
jgi:WD40 repeat protein